MNLKYKLQIIAENITGKRCENCKHNRKGICQHPKNSECCKHIVPVHWEKK